MDLPRGAITAVLGASGEGTLTLLRLVAGLDAVPPDALVIDEPFAGADARSRIEIAAALRDLADRGATVVLATSDEARALEVADHVVVLDEGRLVQAGTAAEVYDAPASLAAMRASGVVTHIGDRFVRPNDIDVHVEPVESGFEAQLAWVSRAGSEVRVEADLADGRRVSVTVSRQEALELELEPDQIVWLRPHGGHRFDPPEAERISA
ncbi:MAG: TOBE-like domain-containing protein [Solirubrobacteraceae bacterium]|nr:TOBE-like domain-containing protein [Solirubrobacteraceae bacterium]